MPATLRYALIARRDVILCDHRPKTEGNFGFMCQEVLDSVLNHGFNNKFSFDHGKHTYHAFVSGNLVYVCVADAVFDKNVAFNFLFELERQFVSAGLKERANSAGLYSLRSAFEPTMASVLARFSTSDSLSRLESKVEDVTGVMRQNIDKVVERGDTLHDLNERSDLLAHSSTEFRQTAVKLRQKLCWKNVRLWVILLVILITLIVIIAVIIIAVLAAQGKL